MMDWLWDAYQNVAPPPRYPADIEDIYVDHWSVQRPQANSRSTGTKYPQNCTVHCVTICDRHGAFGNG